MLGKQRVGVGVETGTETLETTYQDRDATSKGYLSVLSQRASTKQTAKKQGKPLFQYDLLIIPHGASLGRTEMTRLVRVRGPEWRN